MPRGNLLRGWSIVLGVLALGITQAQSASALAIGFTAQVLSREGRETGVVPTYSFQGLPPGLGLEHEVLLLEYDTSGAPFYVSSVTWTATSTTKFVATSDGVPQPLTEASLVSNPVGGSSAPTTAATINNTSFGNKLTQVYNYVASPGTGPEFKQGLNNSELTYVEINNTAGEMKGVTYGNDLLAFQNAIVTVTFTPIPGSSSSLTAFTLTGQFAIQTTPPYGVDNSTRNFGSAGGHTDITLPQSFVPEPGFLPTLLGAGVSGSLMFFRRRRNVA